MKRALIPGITGQDGAYLAEFLLAKGYEVHGIKRRASSFNTERIDHLYQDPHEHDPQLVLHYGNLTDATNLICILRQVEPDEVYNLGAQSHVQVPFETPEDTANADGMGTLRLLDLNAHICPGGMCRAELNGQVTYRDNQHLSSSFAEFLAEHFPRH